MARTINFDFTQGGGTSITEGRVTLAPTHTRADGQVIVLPGPTPAPLVGGQASIPGVEPTPADESWLYLLKVESVERLEHTFIITVPTGTTPIDFSLSWVKESMTLPLDASGVTIQQWIQSVRAHAAAADVNAVNALASAADAHTRLDGLEVGADPADVYPPGGITGQALIKKSNANYDVKWGTVAGGGGGGYGGAGTMVAVYQRTDGTYQRPTTDPTIRVLFIGTEDPGTTSFENDLWGRLP